MKQQAYEYIEHAFGQDAQPIEYLESGEPIPTQSGSQGASNILLPAIIQRHGEPKRHILIDRNRYGYASASDFSS